MGFTGVHICTMFFLLVVKKIIKLLSLVKILMFSSHSMKYTWHSPQKDKYPLYIIQVFYRNDNTKTITDQMRPYLAKQMTSTRKWCTCMSFLLILVDHLSSGPLIQVSCPLGHTVTGRFYQNFFDTHTHTRWESFTRRSVQARVDPRQRYSH